MGPTVCTLFHIIIRSYYKPTVRLLLAMWSLHCLTNYISFDVIVQVCYR